MQIVIHSINLSEVWCICYYLPSTVHHLQMFVSLCQ